MPLDGQALRATMRQWATGVTVVTTVHEGRRSGMTVSSFTSVSLEPPTVLVCINKSASSHDRIAASGVYAISLLASDQDAISTRFAGEEADAELRFDGLEFITGETGAPLISGAVGWLDCRVRHHTDAYTHTIFVAEVVFAQANEGVPLVYYNRRYQRLVPIE